MPRNGEDNGYKYDRVRLCGWPTDVLIIDDSNALNTPHTIILFIPGNPGVIHWYADSLLEITKRLGRGYVVRGVSYAGHGVGDEIVGSKDDHDQSFHSENLGKKNEEDGHARDMSVPWTMEGQIQHKIKYVDYVLKDWGKSTSSNTPNLVFISHSIGAHFVQSILLRRPDILAKTQQVINLMPFWRFDPPPFKKVLLSSAASFYQTTIPMMTKLTKAFSTLPRGWISLYLDKAHGINCSKGREIALDIFMHPNMVRNHLVLGLEEIRGKYCLFPVSFLVCSHISDLKTFFVLCTFNRTPRASKCKRVHQ